MRTHVPAASSHGDHVWPPVSWLSSREAQLAFAWRTLTLLNEIEVLHDAACGFALCAGGSPWPTGSGQADAVGPSFDIKTVLRVGCYGCGRSDAAAVSSWAHRTCSMASRCHLGCFHSLPADAAAVVNALGAVNGSRAAYLFVLCTCACRIAMALPVTKQLLGACTQTTTFLPIINRCTMHHPLSLSPVPPTPQSHPVLTTEATTS